MDLDTSKALHPSRYPSHRVTLHIPGPGTALRNFHGSCSCGDASGPLPSAGAVWGWEAWHRDAMREQAIAAKEATDRAWELFESMHGGEQ